MKISQIEILRRLNIMSSMSKDQIDKYVSMFKRARRELHIKDFNRLVNMSLKFAEGV